MSWLTPADAHRRPGRRWASCRERRRRRRRGAHRSRGHVEFARAPDRHSRRRRPRSRRSGTGSGRVMAVADGVRGYATVSVEPPRRIDGGGLLPPATPPDTVPHGSALVRRIVITPATLTLAGDSSAPLTARILDEHGAVLTAQPVRWQVSSGDVVRITPQGVVTAHRPGTAQVTAVVGRVHGDAEVSVPYPKPVLPPPVARPRPTPSPQLPGGQGCSVTGGSNQRPPPSGGSGRIPCGPILWSRHPPLSRSSSCVRGRRSRAGG